MVKTVVNEKANKITKIVEITTNKVNVSVSPQMLSKQMQLIYTADYGIRGFRASIGSSFIFYFVGSVIFVVQTTETFKESCQTHITNQRCPLDANWILHMIDLSQRRGFRYEQKPQDR